MRIASAVSSVNHMPALWNALWWTIVVLIIVWILFKKSYPSTMVPFLSRYFIIHTTVVYLLLGILAWMRLKAIISSSWIAMMN